MLCSVYWMNSSKMKHTMLWGYELKATVNYSEYYWTLDCVRLTLVVYMDVQNMS